MLSPKQRRHLKAEAHHLKPVLHVGKGGVTPAVAAELDEVLDSLELVKVKLNPNTFEDEEGAVAALLARIPDLEHGTQMFWRLLQRWSRESMCCASMAGPTRVP